MSPTLTLVSRIERPIVWILEGISGFVVSVLSGEKTSDKKAFTEDEFKTLIDVYQKEGGLEGAQSDLIHSVFALADKPVSEIMIPRIEMFCLPISFGMAEMEAEIIKARHTSIPIYGADRDDILGILASDLIAGISGKGIHIDMLLRKSWFVPEVKSAASLLREFKSRRIQIAIVVDEYGGVSGMVTLEDVLESLFEDIYEDYGLKDNLWQKVDERTFLVSGRMSAEDLNALIGISIPEDKFDTVDGFVFHLFGELPAKGEETASKTTRFEWRGWVGQDLKASG